MQALTQMLNPQGGGGNAGDRPAPPSRRKVLIVVGVIYLGMMLFSKYNQSQPSIDPVTRQPLKPHVNILSPGDLLDLRVYFSSGSKLWIEDDNTVLVWEEKGFAYDKKEPSRETVFNMTLPQAVSDGKRKLYAHVVAFPSGTRSVDPNKLAPHGLDPGVTFMASSEITKMMKMLTRKELKALLGSTVEPEVELRRSKKKERPADERPTAAAGGHHANDAGGDGDDDDEEDERRLPKHPVPHIHPLFKISLVHDKHVYQQGKIPPTTAPHLKIARGGKYQPILYLNEFWMTKDEFVPLNKSQENVIEFHLSLNVMANFKFLALKQFDQALSMQSQFGIEQGDSSDVKRMFKDANTYLLTITLIVSFFHSIFDFLAFKNDIKFWKTRKNLEGISIRTIFVNIVMEGIIFLYLLDNETSAMIKISAGVTVAIEIWKVKKAAKKIHWMRWKGVIPYVRIEEHESYQKETKEYDRKATKFLTLLFIPLVMGYAVYALKYEKHKSWYSFVIGTLVGSVYAFGFIMMCPQLFINYKLKSVAHLPWRVFVYKSLNTFIDDLFAFTIKMPTLHRISVFRDDVVFFVFLYQRWIYRVDKTRVNEYGQSFDDEEKKKKEEEAEAEAAASGKEEKEKAQVDKSAPEQEEGGTLRKRTNVTGNVVEAESIK